MKMRRLRKISALRSATHWSLKKCFVNFGLRMNRVFRCLAQAVGRRAP